MTNIHMENDIQPGTFRDAPGDEITSERTIQEPEIEYTQDLIDGYTAFRDQIFRPTSVLYSSCGYDASPSRVFASVTFVDIEPAYINALQKAGLHAIRTDIRDYTPEELHDLVLLMNPAIPPEWATQHLRPGGYVIANDWHKTARAIFGQPEQFALVGAIKVEGQKGLTTDITDLFVPAKDGEELKRLRPQHHAFIMKAYPHLIRGTGIEPSTNFEEMYFQFEKKEKVLPFRRTADSYIFMKR